MSDCCECHSESFYVDIGRSDSNNSPILVSADGREIVRGPSAGDFLADRPLLCFVHADWCCHRPTKASANAYAEWNTNGSVRVFVEADADVTKCVWAELVIDGCVAFPQFDDHYHYEGNDGTGSVKAASYSWSFGKQGDAWVFTPRNQQDGTAYLTSPWPLLSMLTDDFGRPIGYVTDDHYIGSRLSYRIGYRSDSTDTTVIEFDSLF